MALFQYPKGKHVRKLSPRQFKHYGTYKRYLQTEFARVCVYCRQPDSSAPNLNFGVDHYRPKSISRFANLRCDYLNLYYCCGSCNSRKNADWPQDENAGPFVVNPCDHEMAKHLSFDAKTGKVVPKSDYGKHTEKLLQLNDAVTVQYRLGTLKTVELYVAEIASQERLLTALSAKLKSGHIQQAAYEIEVAEIDQEVALLRDTMWRCTGELPLSPLPKQRNGLAL